MVRLRLATQDATRALAFAIAPELRPGDLIGLVGGLGSGKSFFARAVIGARLRAAGRDEEIPSPSYTLVQTYDAGDAEIWHADLYRLGDVAEAAEIGLEDAFDTAICVVEWADRLAGSLPARRLTIELGFDPDDADARNATLRILGPGWDRVAAAVDIAELAASAS